MGEIISTISVVKKEYKNTRTKILNQEKDKIDGITMQYMILSHPHLKEVLEREKIEIQFAICLYIRRTKTLRVGASLMTVSLQGRK